ncbi:hypothetical protein ES332_A02G123700v1 [Gossypium tomentosum]|uniref:Uncharacterized protein n=1 Tax=Gossypium tomentosum TaxID=34277 RepID=A0A5D2RJ84_GOSTO|nr:hypothetical protein ES332_A02G123700v1 [Gossypium tomentosum]
MAMGEIFYKLNRVKFDVSNTSFISHLHQAIKVINFYFIFERLRVFHPLSARSTIVADFRWFSDLNGSAL